jgi:hypothetical protein
MKSFMKAAVLMIFLALLGATYLAGQYFDEYQAPATTAPQIRSPLFWAMSGLSGSI